jgi:hypothetical protein
VRSLAAAAALAALVAPSARAATVTSEVTTEYDVRGPYAAHTVRVAAAPGEVNRLELAWESTFALRLHDPAGLTPAAPCVAVDPATVSCPQRGTLTVAVVLGDGDDTLTSAIEPQRSPRVLADGGEGDDTLTFGGDSELKGGPGADRLTGGTVEGGPGPDVLQGGSLSYADHTEGTHANLAGDTAAGAPGENDTVLPGFTDFIGGAGPDVVRAAQRSVSFDGGAGDDVFDGSPDADFVEGGAGDDILRGHGGSDELYDDADSDDRLEGGDGHDYLFAGPGDDTLDGGRDPDRMIGEAGADILLARDGAHDRIACGGTIAQQRLEDDRATLDPKDTDSWCNHVDRSGAKRLEVHALQRVGSRGLALVVSCPGRRACRGSVRVNGYGSPAKLGQVSARRSFRVAPRHRARLKLRLDRPVRTRSYDFTARVRAAHRTLVATLDRPFSGGRAARR